VEGDCAGSPLAPDRGFVTNNGPSGPSPSPPETRKRWRDPIEGWSRLSLGDFAIPAENPANLGTPKGYEKYAFDRRKAQAQMFLVGNLKLRQRLPAGRKAVAAGHGSGSSCRSIRSNRRRRQYATSGCEWRRPGSTFPPHTPRLAAFRFLYLDTAFDRRLVVQIEGAHAPRRLQSPAHVPVLVPRHGVRPAASGTDRGRPRTPQVAIPASANSIERTEQTRCMSHPQEEVGR